MITIVCNACLKVFKNDDIIETHKEIKDFHLCKDCKKASDESYFDGILSEDEIDYVNIIKKYRNLSLDNDYENHSNYHKKGILNNE